MADAFDAKMLWRPEKPHGRRTVIREMPGTSEVELRVTNTEFGLSISQVFQEYRMVRVEGPDLHKKKRQSLANLARTCYCFSEIITTF
jgi:hypothetical protein